MYYKLLNKNVITTALVALMLLSNAGYCEAQGVVALVEEDAVSPKDNTVDDVKKDNLASKEEVDDFSFEIDAEIPDTIPEDEGIIPFDDEAVISPAPVLSPVKDTPATDNQPVAETLKKETIVENQDKANPDKDIKDASVKEEVVASQQVNVPTNQLPVAKPNATVDADFDLGLNALEAPVANNGLGNVKNTLPSEEKKPEEPQVPKEPFANSVLSKIDNDLFSQMSDIEKQTTLLTLELKREKVRNEIEAVKAQRTKAEEEKIAAQEEKKRQEFEWKKEQEAKVYREQQLLKEKEIELEKIKQKKVLNAYMNKMLEDKQVWIQENAELFKALREVEESRDKLAEEFKEKLNNLTTVSNKMLQSANSAKSNHDRTVASLTAQNIQLKKRLEAETTASQNAQNPFNPALDTDLSANPVSTEPQIDISKEYAVLDIIGKGDNLIAKLINKEGDAVIARKGTVLSTGHTVEEITTSFIVFNIQGTKQFLYTIGSFNPQAEEKKEAMIVEAPQKPSVQVKEKSRNIGDSSAPSLGAGMFIK